MSTLENGETGSEVQYIMALKVGSPISLSTVSALNVILQSI